MSFPDGHVMADSADVTDVTWHARNLLVIWAAVGAITAVFNITV